MTVEICGNFWVTQYICIHAYSTDFLKDFDPAYLGGGGDYNEYINYDYERDRGPRTEKRTRPRDRDSGYVA